MKASKAQQAALEKSAVRVVRCRPPAPVTVKAKRPSKYRNVKVVSADGTFDSRREYARWLELKSEYLSARIAKLERQVRFPLLVNGVKVCVWVADFVYERDGVLTVEDSKSSITRVHPVYRLKKKLMLACLGIAVTET